MVQSRNDNKSSTVITEIKSAVLTLLVLHLVAFVFMAVYRLHTQQYYIAEAKIAREFEAQTAARELAASAETNSKPTKTVKKKTAVNLNITVENPLEQYAAPVQSLSVSLSKARESILAKMEIIGRHVDKLNLLEQKTEKLLLSTIVPDTRDDESSYEVNTNAQLKTWRKLLTISSLRDIPEDELEGVFQYASKEILEVVNFEDNDDSENSDRVRNKLAKQFLFDSGLGANIVKEPSQFVCPEYSRELMTDIDGGENESIKRLQKRNEAAHESDLQTYLKGFEEKFGNRIQARGIQALLPKSIESLEDEIELKIGDILDDIFQLADDLEEQVEAKKLQTDDAIGIDNSIASTSCIDKDLVNELVSAGLNAQAAHADVRESLRKTILRYDAASEKELILDADLDAIGGGTSRGRKTGTKRRRGEYPTIKNINLQSTIDSPLLMKSIFWIDAFVDVIGGYSDDLDLYLDSLTGFYGTNSVGEIFVERVLEQAGKVGDINLEKYSDSIESILRSMMNKR